MRKTSAISGALTSLATLIDRGLQRVIRPRSRQIAWVSMPDFAGNSYHLFRHLLVTRTGLRHVWLVVDDDARRRIHEDLARLPPSAVAENSVQILHRHSPRGYLAFLCSKFVFHTHGVYRMTTAAYRDRRIVSLWHGMPIKCIGALNLRSPNPHPTFGTHHIATSAMFRSIIAAAFRAEFDDVILSGLPRCDTLVDPSPVAATRDQVRSALGVEDQKTLVLWMPTYRTVSTRAHLETGVAGPQTFLDDLEEGQLAKIDDLAGSHGCEIVVKLHPDDPLNDLDLDLGLENIRFLPARAFLEIGVELYDVLGHTDALITDVSSVVIDFATTSRPIGILGFDPANYTRDVVISPSAIIRSRRVQDLSVAEQRDEFFRRVASGVPVAEEDDDLRAWLQQGTPGSGCETVLAAVDL